MNSNEIVPFGKYKGQPIEVMQHDRGYCEWLMGQDWLQTRFPQLRTIIVNNFTEPSETPEHNALQARFLDDDILIATLLAVKGEDWFPKGCLANELKPVKVAFEQRGADVLIQKDYHRITITDEVKIQKTLERLMNGYSQSWGYYKDECEDALKEYSKTGILTAVIRFSDIAIELKPSMGDDYPAVMRQVSAMSRGGDFFHSVVIIGSYAGRGATLEQVRTMFEKSNIKLFLLSEIEEIAKSLS